MSRAVTITVMVLLACCAPRAEDVQMTVTSPAFAANGEIPRQYGCASLSVSPPSPPLAFSGAPAGTKSLALLMTDPDAPGGTFTHWVVWNLRADLLSIAEGESLGAPQGRNGFGNTGYGPPCPPSGSHRYVFDVYALDTQLGLTPGAEREQVETAMKGHILAKGQLVGTYRK